MHIAFCDTMLTFDPHLLVAFLSWGQTAYYAHPVQSIAGSGIKDMGGIVVAAAFGMVSVKDGNSSSM